MSAFDHLQPQQLKLFMSGVEWQSVVTHSTDGPMPALWKEREDQSRVPSTGPNSPHGAGVYDSISSHGYVHNPADPPTIIFEDSPSGKSVRTVQSEGHHRVAAAAAIERDTGRPVYIPTNYVDNTYSALKRRRGGTS